MQPNELLHHVARCLEQIGIPYFVTGAVAGILYGEPRLTNDIDIVADIRDGQLPELKRRFPEDDFYLDLDSAVRAIRMKTQFNIIHPASGLKIDVMIPSAHPFDRSRFARVRRIGSDAQNEACFASPEDVIIKKMEYHREGRSEKHVRDILGILRVSAGRIDFEYISSWAHQLGLDDIWTAIRGRLG